MHKYFLIMMAMLMLMPSCAYQPIEIGEGDLIIRIEQGDNWIHDFKLPVGTKKNTPQIAVWTEDTTGQYLSTLYVTRKAATQGWIAAGGNRRKEALPRWCHQRGIPYADGLYLPTKDQPLPDALTGATPKGSFSVGCQPDNQKKIRILVEVNHSTDFNGVYSADLEPGDPHYSGGKEGSGQPALVYMAEVDLDSTDSVFEARLMGHSSPDGSDGDLYTDMEGIDSALGILRSVTVVRKK